MVGNPGFEPGVFAFQKQRERPDFPNFRYMVLPEGIKPPSEVCKTTVLSLDEGSINLVDRKRIELFPPVCKTGVLPLSLLAHISGAP